MAPRAEAVHAGGGRQFTCAMRSYASTLVIRTRGMSNFFLIHVFGGGDGVASGSSMHEQ